MKIPVFTTPFRAALSLLDSTRKSLVSVLNTCTERAHERAHMESCLEQMLHQGTTIDRNLDRLQEQIDDLKDDLSRCQFLLSRTESQLEESQKDLILSKSEVSRKERVIQSLLSKHREYRTDAQNTLSNVRATSDTRYNMIQSLERMVWFLESERSKLQERLQRKESYVQDLKKSLLDMQEQLDSNRQEVTHPSQKPAPKAPRTSSRKKSSR